MLKTTLLTAALALAATTALAESQAYRFDTEDSQIVFSCEHLGFSTTTGMISESKGTIDFDDQDPAASSVTASFSHRVADDRRCRARQAFPVTRFLRKRRRKPRGHLHLNRD